METETSLKVRSMIADAADRHLSDVGHHEKLELLQLDSLDMLALKSDLEAEFNIRFHPPQEWIFVYDVCNAVERATGAA